MDSKAKIIRELRKAQSQQGGRLAQEMDRIHEEVMKENKLRQKLRESSVELRDLEAQLRTAYVSKELAAQLAEKQSARMEEKLREKETAEVIRAMWGRQIAAEVEREAEECRHKLQYGAELQSQIVCAERMKQVAYEDFMREKKILDDVAQKIHDEDERELELKMLKVQKTKEEREAFHKERVVWKQMERERMEEENRRIEQYLADRSVQEKKRLAQLKQQEVKKAVFTEKIARQIHELETKRREEEEVMQQLAEEERKAETEARQQLELERKFRMHVEARQACRDEMAAKLKKLQQEAEEEVEYRQQLMKEFAESERLEQLTAEKRRLKILEYRRTVNDVLEERRRRREEELRQLQRMHELEMEEEKARKCVIEEERLRLLKEHASNLIDYLPPGVLREDDLPHLGAEFAKRYGHIDERQLKH